MKKMNPTTSGVRGMSYVDGNDYSKEKVPRRLSMSLKRNAGRDVFGHISTRHKGGGVKRLYRIVEFGQNQISKIGEVISINYDPYRNCNIALIGYDDQKAFILAPEKLKIGDKIECGENTKPVPGNRMMLKNIPNGIPIHNIEIQPNSKGKFVRSAGNSALILSKDDKYAHIRMPSGEVRKILLNSFASIGRLSNIEYKAINFGKAGRKRLMGIRPTVRGKAMYPKAHPHGGGEGNNPIGLKYPKTPWGKHALGVKTRKRNKPSGKFIVKRRK